MRCFYTRVVPHTSDSVSADTMQYMLNSAKTSIVHGYGNVICQISYTYLSIYDLFALQAGSRYFFSTAAKRNITPDIDEVP